jgi:uncharacterized protein (DUF924 family)
MDRFSCPQKQISLVDMNHTDVIKYWFSEKSRQHWFSSTPEIDNEIKQRYEQLWINAASGKLNDWQDSPQGCLALIIILDQFPLNMFRGEAKSFQTEELAVEVALKAIDNGYDEILNTEELLFLFMPLMHSENLEHQNMQVKLFEKYDFNDEYSKHHRDIVKRFGRFPHRNEILGRMSTMVELDYLLSDNAFKG